MKKVLVIGAGFLQRYVIRRAKELGYYTLAVDGNPNAVGFLDADEFAAINIVDQEAVCAYAREKQVDGVLTAATDYGVLSAAFTAQKLGLPGINYAAAKRIKNKYEVRKCLYEAGADDTGLSHEVSEETDLAKLANIVKYPVMVKPCDGSGSRGAAKVEKPADFATACKEAMACSLTRRATVEPFIDGCEYGVESYVHHGKIHVMAIMKKTDLFSTVGVSVAGGITHNLGQVLVAMLLLRTAEIGYYMIVLSVTGILAGLFVGLCGALLIKRLNFYEKQI